MDIRQCEICGRQFIAGYGYSLAINWLVTGHASIQAFLCEKAGPSGQHWGCCPEHAIQLAEKCLHEHMHSDELIRRYEEHAKNQRNLLLSPLIQQLRIERKKGEDTTDLEKEIIQISDMEIPRYSADDSAWAKDKGVDFHIVQVKGGGPL